MKTYLAIGILLLACSTVLAQTTPSTQQGGKSDNMSGMKSGGTQKSHMADMHEHMKEMQAEMDQMKSQVAKMRADAEKVQDANIKTALLDNADMWERFVTRMQSHMQMMGEMHGGMMGGGMMGHGSMHHKSTTPPSNQPPTPKQQ